MSTVKGCETIACLSRRHKNGVTEQIVLLDNGTMLQRHNARVKRWPWDITCADKVNRKYGEYRWRQDVLLSNAPDVIAELVANGWKLKQPLPADLRKYIVFQAMNPPEPPAAVNYGTQSMYVTASWQATSSCLASF